MQNKFTQHITCSSCQAQYKISALGPARFCSFCNVSLPKEDSSANDSIIGGRYRVEKSIGKGGMGEVILAYDASCERKIALKRIRPDLTRHPQIQERFLKEARITCQLIHPAIIPIYTIHHDSAITYYTMPFVEGETLKQIIRKTRQQEKNGEELDHIGGSTPALMRIFITICQAVAYAHSKHVIHRDLKLENIIIGKYGEVLLLDWGLAQWIDGHPDQDSDLPSPPPSILNKEITRLGKVVGTIAYMAPERALGQPATIQTDIYSLGVILYQMLTLHSPFKRGKTIEEFRKTVGQEEFVDPVLVAPYRDVPHLLSRIVKRCLSIDLNERYRTVDNLIRDLENYIEGRSDWFYATQLDIKQKSDWEFQENVLIAEHTAITRVMEEEEWVSLMISHSSFTGNIKIETEICIQANGHGIGFLLSIPETGARQHLNDGYYLWIASDLHRSTKLLKSSVEVMTAPDIFLRRNQQHHIRIEKVEQNIHLYIDDILQLSYITHLPLIGTHIGLLARDADFDIAPLKVYVGSLNIMVNCLAVPDAFLAHQDFDQALSEYRRIAYSFPDRLEGREAIFRSGLTLIEQAKKNLNKDLLLDQALNEFEKLHYTPGAPLEYLGKALVYQIIGDEVEEIKCFELAYRRYPKHPLLPVLQEQLLSRMHEVARHNRIAAYNFVLLGVRHLPAYVIDTHTKRLFSSLQKHWEHLHFIEQSPHKDKDLQPSHFAIQLAFWLARPYILGEIVEELSKELPHFSIELKNALFCLIELGSCEYAQKKIYSIQAAQANQEAAAWQNLEIAIASQNSPIEIVLEAFFHSLPPALEFQDWRCLIYLLNIAIDKHLPHLIHQSISKLKKGALSTEQHLQLDIQQIWAYLLEKNWQAAKEIIYQYPIEFLNKESSALHFLYGCVLRAVEGEEIAILHLTEVLNVPYPRSWTLASHYLIENISLDGLWFSRAFLWEKRQLYRQLALYYACAGNEEKKLEFQKLYDEQFVHAKF